MICKDESSDGAAGVLREELAEGAIETRAVQLGWDDRFFRRHV
jgi:hypothetical protein